MKRMLILLLTIGAFIGTAYAHNGMIHVMGTATAVSDTSITVKTTDGKTQSVVVTSETKYSKAAKIATLKDIKAGDHLVIHATKKGDQLVAAEVKIGAMIMKGMDGEMGGMKMDSHPATTPPK